MDSSAWAAVSIKSRQSQSSRDLPLVPRGSLSESMIGMLSYDPCKIIRGAVVAWRKSMADERSARGSFVADGFSLG
jgi:hypothetical protein